MKYYVFAGDWYYPSGGIEDLVGTFDTLPDAKRFLADWVQKNGDYTWGHIADENMKLVEEESQRYES